MLPPDTNFSTGEGRTTETGSLFADSIQPRAPIHPGRAKRKAKANPKSADEDEDSLDQVDNLVAITT